MKEKQLSHFQRLCQQGKAGHPKTQQAKKRRPSEKLIRFINENGKTLFCVPSGAEIIYQIAEETINAYVFFIDNETMEIMQLYKGSIVIKQVLTADFCKNIYQCNGKISVSSYNPPF